MVRILFVALIVLPSSGSNSIAQDAMSVPTYQVATKWSGPIHAVSGNGGYFVSITAAPVGVTEIISIDRPGASVSLYDRRLSYPSWTIVSTEGRWLAALCGKTIAIWDCHSGELHHRFDSATGPNSILTSMRFSPSGNLLGTGGDKRFDILSTTQRRTITRFDDIPYYVFDLDIADNDRLVVATYRTFFDRSNAINVDTKTRLPGLGEKEAKAVTIPTGKRILLNSPANVGFYLKRFLGKDAKRIITVGEDVMSREGNLIGVWDVETGVLKTMTRLGDQDLAGC